MKTIKYLFCGIILASAFLFSNQITAQNKSRFGIKGGFNVSNMFAENVEASKIKVGINGGIFLRVGVTDNFSFQPELIYTMKGGSLEYIDLVNGSVKISMNYIEVPILAVFNITENINLQGGIYLASLSNVSIRNKSDNGSFNFEEELNKDNFKLFDYGLSCGLGGDFDKISVGFRYDYGIRSIGDKRTFNGQTYLFPDARNSAFQLYIGLSIL